MVEAIRQGDIPGVQLRCRRELSLALGEAWSRVSSSEGVSGWLCGRATMTIEEGGELEWRGSHDLGEGCVELGTVLRAEAPRLLTLSLRQAEWSVATHLRLELSPTPNGCEISVLQNGFEHLPLSHSLTVWEAYRRRWRLALERLAAIN